MKRVISSVLLATVLFLIPSNLFLNLSDQFAYVNGIRVDYLIIKLYLSEVVAWIPIGWHFVTRGIPKVSWSPWGRAVVGLATVLIGLQFFSVLPLISLWESLKLIQLGLLVWVIAQNNTFFRSNWFASVLVVTLLFQSGLGLYQFLTQSSLASYTFLGETNLQSYAGLAKGNFNHIEKILPYGTTAHPNVLAGVLAIYLTMLWWSIKKKSGSVLKLVVTLISILALVTLFLTQSISGWLTLGIGTGLMLFSKKIVSVAQKYSWQFLTTLLLISSSVILLLPIFNTKVFSFTRRVYLNQAALSMIQQRPQGFGLGTVTTQIEKFSTSKEVVRFIQPPHHLGLLWLAETGILGITFLAAAVIYFRKEYPTTLQALLLTFLWLLPIISLDHYLLTIESGKLLLAVTVGFTIYKTTALDSE